MRVGMVMRRLLLSAALSLGVADLALADGAKIALVVGNADYRHIPSLDNTLRDARGVADMLRGFGFSVQEGYDLDRPAFESFLRLAVLNIPEGSAVVFFYAGHGIQIGRRNYLLPTDVAFKSVYDLPVESITLDRVVELLSARGASHVAMIDACRENPFPNLRLAANLDAALFETGTGFEVFATPINSLVAFSTSPGQVAYDGEKGGNGPYAQAILAAAPEHAGDNILSLLADVRQRVYHTTKGRQVPWESSTLVEPFYLADSTVLSPPAVVDTTRGTAPDPVGDMSLVFARELRLDAQLAELNGGPLADPVLVEPPQQGQLELATDTAIYRPHLVETRMTRDGGHILRDRFRIRPDRDSPRILTVEMELTPDPCDAEAGDALDLQGVGLYRLPNEIDREAALVACEQAVRQNPGVARFVYQLGRAQQAGGDLQGAYASFSAAAEAGHIRAATAAAYLLLTTRIDRKAIPIPLDEAKANALLEDAIARGDPFAMHSRGLRLLRNGPAETDRQRGFELLERAAELGHSYSMNELGTFFLDPDNPHYRPERGLTYLRASAERKDIYGYNNLGLVALRGYEGVRPDFNVARDWFERAAEGGHPFAPANLGRMIMRGQLGKPDPKAAMRWYDMGLSRGDGWAGVNASSIILKGDASPLGPADAALRAAKALHLPARDAAEQAGQIMDRIRDTDLNRATQMLLNEMGESVLVDGAVGSATLAALDRLGQRSGLGVSSPGEGPRQWLTLAARVWLARNPPRVDLF